MKRLNPSLYRQAAYFALSVAAMIAIIVRLSVAPWWLILLVSLLQLAVARQAVTFGVHLADAHPRSRGGDRTS